MGLATGSQDLQMIQQVLGGMPKGFNGLLGSGKAAGKQPPALGKQTSPAQQEGALPSLLGKSRGITDSFGPNGQTKLDDDFEALFYRSQSTQVSLAAQMQQVRALLDDGESGQTTQLQAQQMSFDFFAESRVEELAIFKQRTNAVAEGLQGTQQETFMQASRSVSMRFSMSMSISGAALNGYAGAAEGLQDGEEASMDQFMGFVDNALKEVDEIVEELFGLVNDLLSGEGDFEDLINQFFNGLSESGLFPSFGTGAAEGTQAQASSFSIQLEFEFEYTEVVQMKKGQVEESDPLVLDLDGDGIELTSHRDGARFDIEGTGRQVNTAFVTGGDAFLAIDRNGNGAIDSGRELFGDQNGASNGFEELRRLDSNNDGVLNALDRDFNSLLLFKDNGNGVTEEGELITLEEAGVKEINLGYRNVNQVAAGGNRIGQIASFLRNDGSRGVAADAILNFTG